MGRSLHYWFYPKWMQALINVLPFLCIFETPLNIYTGTVSSTGIGYSLLLQILWAVVLIILGKGMWLGVHRYLTVQGG